MPTEPPRISRAARVAGSAIIGIVLFVPIELSLRMIQAFQKPATRWIDRRYGEAFYYSTHVQPPPGTTPPNYDPVLGWRNRPNQRPGVSVNREFWRSRHEFSASKDRPRICVLGDSFIFGDGVGDDETIPSRLQEIVGPSRECMNFGVAGYGLDQISLLATEVLPKYEPDDILLTFIADDLTRSCFAFGFESRKPYFEMTGDAIALKGVPVPTPYETYQYHRRSATRLRDFFFTTVKRSRVAVLAAEPLLAGARAECFERINPLILKRVADFWKGRARVRFVHLDGELPRGFEEGVRRLGLDLFSVPPVVPRLAAALGVTPDRYDDAFAHPKPAMNRILAHALHEALLAR